jgi:translation initiation factor IF-2
MARLPARHARECYGAASRFTMAGSRLLRRFQDDVKEVRSGLECGIKLGDFSEYQVGDIIECYVLEQIAQKL